MAILDWFKEIPLSAVLKERLIDFERKVTSLEQENAKLKEEKAILEEQLRNFNMRIEKTDALDIQLDENKINVLKLLFSVQHMDIEKISESLNLSIQFVNFYLTDLQNIGMVKSFKITRERKELNSSMIITRCYDVDVYEIDQKGRKYVIENNLVSS